MRTESEVCAGELEEIMPAVEAEAITALEIDWAAVTGHTVVVRAIVWVTTTPPVAERAGQFVTEAAQL